MPKIIKPAKGTFTTADITVDSSGRIIAASTGSAGGAGAVIPQFDTTAPATFLPKETHKKTKLLIYQ